MTESCTEACEHKKKPNGEFVYSIQLNKSSEVKKNVSAPLTSSDQQKPADKPDPNSGKPVLGIARAFTDTTDSVAQTAETVNREIQESKKRTTQYSISPNLESDLLDVLKDTFDKKNEVYVGSTSNFLTKLLGLRSISVTMPSAKAYSAMVTEGRAKTDGRFRTNTNYHGLGLNGLMRAPEASENPVAVFAARWSAKAE